MGSLVFPMLDRLALKVDREQIDQDIQQEALSGKVWSSSWWLAPKYRYKVGFGGLRSAAAYRELQKVAGFYTRHRGRWDSFLFTDPEDSTVTAHYFDVGDGATTVFQLQRTLVADADLPAATSRAYWPATGDGYEPVYEPNGAPSIYRAGVLQTGGGVGYTLGSNGVVTFTSAPSNGTLLSWTGSYYRRVRFANPSLSMQRIVAGLWSGDSIELVSVKP